MFKKILLPLDGSELSERALDPALALVKQSGGEVILLRVPDFSRYTQAPGDGYGYGYGLMWPDESRQLAWDQAKAYLDFVRQTRRQPGFTLRTEIIEGDVAGVIVDTAATEKVDLIVMSTHGYSGFTRWVMGSVTERVLRSAPCPVLAVRSSFPWQRILVPLDGSELAETAVDPALVVACSLPGKAPAPCTFLRVVEQVNEKEVAYLEEVEPGLSKRVQEQVYDEAGAYLHALAKRYRREGQEIRTVVTVGPAGPGILEYADVTEIDLIVMATHGRTGLRRWVYGSVTEKVLRGAHSSILVIRPAIHTLR